jgi:YegS/Rv2252/BmrU family lipid kinase
VNVVLIANPIAGGGAGSRSVQRAGQVLRARGHSVDLKFTQAAGDAEKLAAAVEPGCECIVVVGGDGTLNEILNGLADPSRIPLALLAVGTANMLARDLGLPRSPDAIAELVESDATRLVDLGRVGVRRFVGNVGVGFDAQIVEEIAQRRTGRLGYRAYVVPMARLLARNREPILDVRIDDGQPTPAAWVVVSNLRNYGGLFTFSRTARCDSGNLEVCCFDRARRRDLLRCGVAAGLGRLDRARGVSYRPARRVIISSGQPVPVQVDGDPFGTTPVEISLDASRIRVLVPAGGAGATGARAG